MDDDEDYSETFQPDLTLPIDSIAEFNEEQLKAYFQEARVKEIHAHPESRQKGTRVLHPILARQRPVEPRLAESLQRYAWF
jgi:hypothetical protein